MRTLSLAVTLVALAVAFAGCTGDENGDDNTQTIDGSGSSIEGTITVVDNESPGSSNGTATNETNSSGA